MSQHNTLMNLVKAVDAEMSESWECASYHPSLRPALEAARAALSATQPAQAAQSTHWTEHEPVRLASSRKGRVYLAGPMTGIADFNFPAFNAEADLLRSQGLSVLNPADHGIVAGANWADYLRHDIAGLASCERIHLLRGWSNSKGAQLEVTIANALGMAITYQEGAEEAQAAQGEPTLKPEQVVEAFNLHFPNTRMAQAYIGFATDLWALGVKAQRAWQSAAGADVQLLDAMERHRIAVVPEFEGTWDASVYGDEGEPQIIGSGDTPRDAIRAAIAASGRKS